MKIETLTVGFVNTNCYIVSDPESSRAAVIDQGDRAGQILERVKNLEVRYIFLTHGHFDHFLAAEEVRGSTGAKIVVHQDDGIYLSDTSLCSPFGKKIKPVKPDILTRNGEKYSLGAYTVEVLHTPGHTPGSICLLMPRTLFTGDTLFEGDCGRCDLPGGDYGAMLESLRVIAALPDDYTVYPGHDVPTTLSREREANLNMLEALGKK